jgi:hypothetical protein
VFARYFIELPLPAPEVEVVLFRSPEEWIPGLARDADARGEQFLADVGFGPKGLRIEKKVAIELGSRTDFPSMTVLPISWRATGAQGLFPSLEADLEVAPLGPTRTQLAISARYDPPLGLIGRAIDRALLHRVAEATLKDFLDRIGEVLSTRAARAG